MLELVWSRMLVEVFGVSLYAVATTTSIFLGGLAVGAFFGGRFLERKRIGARGALYCYTACEGVVAVFAFLVTQVVWSDALASMVAATGGAGLAARFVICLALLGLPAAAMGATYPLVVHALRVLSGAAERSSVLAYAINSAGAALGAALAGFAVLPVMGLVGTSQLATGLAAVSGLSAREVARRVPAQAPGPEQAPPPKPGHQLKISFQLAGLAFAAGWLSLSMQTAWFRFFCLVLGSSVYSQTCALVVACLSCALGSLAANWLYRLCRQAKPLVFLFAAVSALTLTIVLFCVDELPWLFIAIERSFSPALGSFAAAVLARSLVMIACLALPAFGASAVLPSLLAWATGEGKDKADTAAKAAELYAANTAGCIAGALATGFALIPAFSELTTSGMQTTLLLVALGETLLALWACHIWFQELITDSASRGIVFAFTAFMALAGVLDIACFRPSWNRALLSAGAGFFSAADLPKMSHDIFAASVLPASAGPGYRGPELRFYREGLNTTVTVTEDKAHNILGLKNDGKTEAALPSDLSKPAPTSDLPTQVLLGILPVCLQNKQPHTAFVVGYGTGTTASVIAGFPTMQLVHVAELEPAILAAASLFGKSISTSEKISVVTEDARFCLASDATTRYDMIVCQSADPWTAGAANLFSRQFFALAKSRLAPGGIICQWVPLYALSPELFKVLVRTFLSEFPGGAVCVARNAGEAILVGCPDGAVDWQQRAQAAQGQLTAHAGSRLLAAAGLADSQAVADTIAAAGQKLAEYAGQGVLNTDDNLIIEFGVGRQAFSRKENIQENLAGIQSLGASDKQSKQNCAL